MAFVYFGSVLFSHFFTRFRCHLPYVFIIFRSQLFLGSPRSVYTSTMCNYEFICQMNCIFMKLNKHPSDTFTTRSVSHFYSRLGNCRFFFFAFYNTYRVYNFSYWRTIEIIFYFLANIFRILWHFCGSVEQSNGLFSNATISCTFSQNMRLIFQIQGWKFYDIESSFRGFSVYIVAFESQFNE